MEGRCENCGGRGYQCRHYPGRQSSDRRQQRRRVFPQQRAERCDQRRYAFDPHAVRKS